jgi:hypothetical protein
MPAYNAPTLSSTAVLLASMTGVGGVAAGQLTISYINATNPNTTLAYVQFFDAATAGAVTVGTTAPAFFVGVPAFGGGVDTPQLVPYQFRKGIVVAATTTPTGSTAPGSAIPLQIYTKQ